MRLVIFAAPLCLAPFAPSIVIVTLLHLSLASSATFLPPAACHVMQLGGL
jgi:hypothetical protein